MLTHQDHIRTVKDYLLINIKTAFKNMDMKLIRELFTTYNGQTQKYPALV